MKFTIIIPAREGSTRLKNKLLLEVCGKPVIYWTVKNCLKVNNVKRIIVATDSEKIKSVLKELNVDVYLTPPNLQSGSDRIAYVVNQIDDEYIVNVQGDEPLLLPEDIEKVGLQLKESSVSSLFYPIENEQDFKNPNIVKVIMDNEGFAIYFSRSFIPYPRDISFKELKKLSLANKHIGIYGYHRKALLEFAYKLKPSPLEEIEKLEQLRFIQNNIKIKMVKAKKDTLGIDTKYDFEKFCKIMEKSPNI